MFERKPLSLALQQALTTATVAATAVTLPALVQAQEQDLEEVIITGSRIATDANIVTSSPVTTVMAEEIATRGITRVEDLLNDLPSITPELTANESNGATGTAVIDLRGLSSERTLVLTNGHRMGFGDVYELAPDINQVPGALIDRIEVLTGGASSTYGSDAMAGVVNFIMKKDFEGVQVDYQYSAYQHDQGDDAVQAAIAANGFTQAPDSVWDGDTQNINITMGVNSADGRGNITAYLGYRSINAIKQSERDFSACALSSSGGNTCAGSATLPTGLFTPFNGTFYFTVSGDQFVPWDYSYYNYGPLNFFQRPDERYTAGLFGHYEINEHANVYAEFQFMDDQTDAQIAPSGAFFVTSTLNCSNAFLSAQQFAAIGCTAPTDVVPLYIGRRNVEGGPRFDDIRHTSYRVLTGVEGAINDAWSYDAFVNFSRTLLSEVYQNDLSTTRIIRALDVVDVTGVPTCQSVVDGSDPTCVPWNVFETGGVTQAAIDYLTLPLFSDGELSQDQYVAYVTGDLTSHGIVSPMAQDGVQVVLGGEYRDEHMDFNPDQGYQSGDGAGQGGPTAAVEGGIDVAEFFLETRIPLVQGREWIESLTAEIGYRYSDYSGGVSTDTYKVLGEWTPRTGYKLRGGYNQASRYANIRELFEPRNLGLWSGTDPCAGAAPTQTAAQCANSGVTAAQYGSVPLSPAGQYNQIAGGNPDLDAESSSSFTVGAVITPEQVPGLTFSVDYWSIDIEDAIDTLDPEFVVTQCGLTGDAAYCDLVNRGTTNGNLWIGSSATAPHVVATNINIGFYKVSGFDFFAGYGFDVGQYGDVDVNLRGTLVEAADQQLSPGATIDECAGTYAGVCGRPTPEWKHIITGTWHTPWNVNATLSWRFIDGVEEFRTAGSRFDADEQHYLDMTAEYTPTFIGFGETTLSMGVTNVLDNDPPVSGYFNNIATYGNGNTVPGLWDSMGRYFFFAVSQKF
ncbi:MAG: TonB-dependent receptor [Gammaproteobacteria bacterium]|nr:MAG: TonB-dependent receptor [Gammaproteobacteria bacterium]